MGWAAGTSWALSLLSLLSSACEAPTEPTEPAHPPEAAAAPAARATEVAAALDPTLTDPSQVGSAKPIAQPPTPAEDAAPGTLVQLALPCYGSIDVPRADLNSAGEQQRIRLAIRESWQQQGRTHPDYVVAPMASLVEVIRWDGPAALVRPASGPWAGAEVYLPTSCVARGRPKHRP